MLCLLGEWFDSLGMAETYSGSSSKKQCGVVCVADRFREITLLQWCVSCLSHSIGEAG